MYSRPGSQVGFFLTVALEDILTLYLISAENGFYIKSQGEEWQQVYDNVDFSWKPTVKEVCSNFLFCFFPFYLPLMQNRSSSTIQNVLLVPMLSLRIHLLSG